MMLLCECRRYKLINIDYTYDLLAMKFYKTDKFRYAKLLLLQFANLSEAISGMISL